MNPLSHDFPDLIPFNTLNGKPRHHASAPQYFPQLEMIDILQFYNLRYDPSMFIILIYETFSVELMRIPKTQETQVSFILSLILSHCDPASPRNSLFGKRLVSNVPNASENVRFAHYNYRQASPFIHTTKYLNKIQYNHFVNVIPTY